MISLAKHLAFFLSVASLTSANHLFTLVNRCGFGVNMSIDNWSRTPYTGPQPPTIAAGQSWSTTIPSGWDGRICDNRNCYTGGSITEFNLDTGNCTLSKDVSLPLYRRAHAAYSLVYTPQAYDISNINGFSVGQQIDVPGCDTVTCASSSCPCNQAYPPGNLAGTCPNEGTIDNPVRGCGAGNIAFTIVYCP
ncbi:hypothetical protein BS47DRAFT_1485032 [Hydnum rufescens UP504]|uniref:Thaumatin-like protein n=1 Tax=Hydnum rufescens UP504 TaxID=1448309 RepID=A0A9P6AYY2_9AGAM|nr:hypothetical protein BS47DRAFT_1485032 [Hydnum rufescens UP504]